MTRDAALTKARATREPVGAGTVRPKRLRWAWRDVLPAGMVSIIAGQPGSQKSLLGTLIAGEVSQRADVVLGNAEDPWEEIVVPRLAAVGAELGNVILWPLRDAGLDIGELHWQVETLGIRLVVLDPLAAFVIPTRSRMLPLAEMARETGCAVVGLHHTTKGNHSLAALERIAGPTAGAVGTARAVYAFGPHPAAPETERVLAPVKVNVAAPPRSLAFRLKLDKVKLDRFAAEVPRLQLVDESAPVTADQVLSVREPHLGEIEIAAVAEWLTTYLRLGGRPVHEVVEDAAELGVGAQALHRAVNEIGIISSRGKTTNWRLPKRHPLAVHQ